MTDRIKGLTVLLKDNYREDDVEILMQAIRLMKGVIGVNKHIAKSEDYIIRQQVKCDLLQKIAELLA